MTARFEAQNLIQFGRNQVPPSIELTFEDANGERLTVSLPAQVAADALVPILGQFSLLPQRPPGAPGLHQTVSRWQVGHSNETPHVSMWLNDDPPYQMTAPDAAQFCHQLFEEAKLVAQRPPPTKQ